MIGKIALFTLFSQVSYQRATANDTLVIETDVAIVGGGASGTYAAVRLREDLNTSVVVIEPKDHLGGHVSTYHVSEDNSTFEYGVRSYLAYGPAAKFFERFGLATQGFDLGRPLRDVHVDVETGAPLSNYEAPPYPAIQEALGRWLGLITKYESILEPGYWNFPAPKNIPEDLLMPIEDFLKLHQLEAAIPRFVQVSGIGYGGIRHLTTFNLMRSFGVEVTREFINNTWIRPVGSNNLVYDRALALLKSDVLLQSSVQSAKRSANGVQLTVQQGAKTLIVNAKRILYTAPPSESALAPYALDEQERSVFSQGTIQGEWVGVVQTWCLAENTSVIFVPGAAAPNNQLSLKDYPWSLHMDNTGPLGANMFAFSFGANYTLTAEEVRETVSDAAQRAGNGSCTVTFRALSDHTRPHWYTSGEALEAGFMTDLFELQGHASTWYTGYAWAAPYSSTVWAFTDTVLERMLAGM
jgi:hypothetical protein